MEYSTGSGYTWSFGVSLNGVWTTAEATDQCREHLSFSGDAVRPFSEVMVRVFQRCFSIPLRSFLEHFLHDKSRTPRLLRLLCCVIDEQDNGLHIVPANDSDVEILDAGMVRQDASPGRGV